MLNQRHQRITGLAVVRLVILGLHPRHLDSGKTEQDSVT